ncbi:MAG: hypothetical protein DRQ62_09025, partial [Gammaproteobacteria bacterium]
MCEGVNAGLLEISKVVSDDCAHRALHKIDAQGVVQWLQENLFYCYSPLQNFPWILGSDVTEKPEAANSQS